MFMPVGTKGLLPPAVAGVKLVPPTFIAEVGLNSPTDVFILKKPYGYIALPVAAVGLKAAGGIYP